MTISTASNKVVCLGNGATSTFSYNFLIPDASNVVVIYTDASGNETTLLASQYSITGVGNTTGGTVTYPLSGAPIAAGAKLTIMRTVPYVQDTSLVNQSGYYPDVVEGMSDYLTMIAQQLAEQWARALVVSPSDAAGLTLPPATQRALQMLGFDSQGNAIAAQPSSALVSTAMQPFVASNTLLAAVSSLGKIGNVTTSAPILEFDFTESLALAPNAFFDAIVVNHTRTGGSGDRQAFTGQITVSGAAAGEFHVGAAGFGFLNSGSGDVFGLNAYARALSGVDLTAEICGMEVNTDVRGTVNRKTGVQIVDVGTSTHDAAAISAALYIIADPGGVGWQNGIQFGDDLTSGTAPTSQVLIRAAGAPGTMGLHRGIDFRAGNFSGPAIDLPPASTIAFAGGASGNKGAGGTIASETATNGPILVFGTGALLVQDSAAVNTFFSVQTDDSGAPQVQIYVPGVGLREVTAGAANSGGTGFRQLLVAN